MTLFDWIALGLLVISGLMGFFRGAVREMVTVLAFLAAGAAAMATMKISGPIARGFIHPDWAANVAGVLVVFLIVYIALRLLGAGLADRIQRTQVLGMLDRSVGLGFGLVRAVIVLGAFNLAFNAATPPERVPRWISEAKLYPLSTAAARAIQQFAPKGMDLAGRLKPAFEGAVRDGVGDRNVTGGYDARERGGLDDLVEKSR